MRFLLFGAAILGIALGVTFFGTPVRASHNSGTPTFTAPIRVCPQAVGNPYDGTVASSTFGAVSDWNSVLSPLAGYQTIVYVDCATPNVIVRALIPDDGPCEGEAYVTGDGQRTIVVCAPQVLAPSGRFSPSGTTSSSGCATRDNLSTGGLCEMKVYPPGSDPLLIHHEMGHASFNLLDHYFNPDGSCYVGIMNGTTECPLSWPPTSAEISSAFSMVILPPTPTPSPCGGRFC